MSLRERMIRLNGHHVFSSRSSCSSAFSIHFIHRPLDRVLCDRNRSPGRNARAAFARETSHTNVSPSHSITKYPCCFSEQLSPSLVRYDTSWLGTPIFYYSRAQTCSSSSCSTDRSPLHNGKSPITFHDDPSAAAGCPRRSPRRTMMPVNPDRNSSVPPT